MAIFYTMAATADLKYTTPVFKKNQPDDTYKFQPLPAPTGNSPYHLSLNDIQPVANQQQMMFQLVGDTGSVRNASFQRQVAGAMARQNLEAVSKEYQPLFLFHLGDVVYNFGEAEHYFSQFFEPYADYPNPIFAIAGNHDSDVNPASEVPYQSLDAFTSVFCDSVSQPVIFAKSSKRKSMVQPNIYWTLETPLANIIGLHSNVPKFGVITPEQRNWFIEELKTANLERPGKAIIVCIHHAPYSADINHGSSIPMIEFLEGVFEETGIRPDIVFSGHVHNYQRFNKRYADGVTVPYIVAGAGGYDELHPIAYLNDERFTGENPLFDDVQLVHYCDNKHGFMKVTLEKTEAGLTLKGEYYSIAHEEQSAGITVAALDDSFVIKI